MSSFLVTILTSIPVSIGWHKELFTRIGLTALIIYVGVAVWAHLTTLKDK